MAESINPLHKSTNLPPEIEEQLRQAFTRLQFKRGDRITSLSELRDNLFYITRGSARLFYILSGKEHTFSFALEDEVLLVSHVLLYSPDVVVTVEFLEPTEVMLIQQSTLHDMVRTVTNPTLLESLHEARANGFMRYCQFLEERLMMLQNTSATERYAWMCRRYPRIIERATITQVASFLGITRETLYRIRSQKYKVGK